MQLIHHPTYTKVYFNILNVFISNIYNNDEEKIINIIKENLKRYNIPYTEIMTARAQDQLDIRFEMVTGDTLLVTKICRNIDKDINDTTNAEINVCEIN